MRQAEQRLRVIRLLLIWQFVGALAAGLVGGLWGLSAALGALAGGIIVWLPNCYFAFRAFRHRGARAARLIVRSFYAGVTGKIFLTASLFVVVFINLKPLNAPAIFAGFIAVQMLNWIVPLLASRQKKAL
ncbi:MAG: ATP synthase subunit I [Granulosicoccus sp.]